jgi:hypothetical protein
MAARRKLKDAVLRAAHAADRVVADAEIARLRGENAALAAKYKQALKQLDAAGQRAEALAGLSGLKPRKIAARASRGKASPVTAILVCSDWHVEEFVDEKTVAGRNRYTIQIAAERVAEMTRRAMLLLDHESRLAPIHRVVVAALGDFITNEIHPDTPTQLKPLEATRYACELLSGVIDAVASRYREVIVATCNGNHGRTTPKLSIASGHLYSYEHAGYVTLAAANKRKNVVWQIGEGYHNWLDLDGFKVRLHHGEAIKSNGGIGGVSISANKAIAQWNRMEAADLDIFGHHHQFSWNYGRYVSNGSLIGWNAFANFIRAEYQPATQAAVLVDRDRGVTKAMPIFCEVRK